MFNPVAYLSKSDTNTIYFHQVMNEPNVEKFIAAVVQEMNDHTKKGCWVLVSRNNASDGIDVGVNVDMLCRKRWGCWIRNHVWNSWKGGV